MNIRAPAVFFVLCFAFFCSAEQKSTDKRSLTNGLLNTGGIGYALLVGLDDCDAPASDSIPKLKHAESEVERIYRLLDKQTYTATLITGKDATVQNVENYIRKISDSATTTDRILFYFAGHGLTFRNSKPILNFIEESCDKDTFCILLRKPVGQSYYHEYLAMPWLVRTLNKSNAIQRIIIVNACFSGDINPEIIPNRDFYNHILSNANYFSLTAWADTIFEGDYTEAIINGLEGRADLHPTGNTDKKVDVFELSRYVDLTVGKKTIGKRDAYNARTAFIGAGTLFLTNVGDK